MQQRYCCDMKCEQGRHCPKQQPAEAATEIGCDDDDSEAHSMSYLISTIIIVCAIVAVIIFAGAI